MIYSLFILNSTGEVLIDKHYRGLLSRNICDYFWDEVTKAERPDDVLPIIQTPKYYLLHIQKNGLYLLAVCASEINPLMIFEFLHRVFEVFAQYFEKLTEQAIRENFVTIYQLLDEMMDNGIPFTTEPNALMDLIPAPNLIQKVVTGITGQSAMKDSTMDQSQQQQSSLTPWRKIGVKHSANEIYFDIIEEIDCLIEPNGLAVSMEVSGEIQSLSKLSGMPDLTLHFNNPHILDDVSFHPCVRYARYEQHKILSFVPPDGAFKLMNYRVKGQLQLPIYVKPQVSWSGTGGKISVMVGVKNSGGKVVEDVIITIPYSKSVASANLTANVGSIQFDDIAKITKWNIGKIPKDKTPMVEGTISLIPGTTAPESNPTISAEFKISMFTSSGLKIETLQLHNEKYKPYKGVRSVTKSGKVHIRS